MAPFLLTTKHFQLARWTLRSQVVLSMLKLPTSAFVTDLTERKCARRSVTLFLTIRLYLFFSSGTESHVIFACSLSLNRACLCALVTRFVSM
jgi:hypothetical protein